MSDTTGIQWTDTTWNVVTGCTTVSAGCKHCYAERDFHRPYPGRDFTDIRFHEDRLDKPLRWRKPRRVFVNSLSYLFHEAIPDETIDRIFAVMALAPPHTFQVLTKRPERMRDYFAHALTVPLSGYPGRESRVVAEVYRLAETRGEICGTLPEAFWTWPLPNVHLGVSVEDQPTADERIPLLLQTPAAVRFVSAEPLLGPVSFRWMNAWPENAPRTAMNLAAGRTDHLDGLRRLDWIIAGGESGPRARPCDVAWIRSIVEQCRAASVPCFVKQMGRWIAGSEAGFGPVRNWHMGDHVFGPPIIGEAARRRPEGGIAFSLIGLKGGEPRDWPEDLRVREFPR